MHQFRAVWSESELGRLLHRDHASKVLSLFLARLIQLTHRPLLHPPLQQVSLDPPLPADLDRRDVTLPGQTAAGESMQFEVGGYFVNG